MGKINTRSTSDDVQTSTTKASDCVTISESDRNSIKEHYLGGHKERRKIIHPSERMRFVFDWDLTEDTSRTKNPFYEPSGDISLLFGRGIVGGVDRSEQLKINLLNESEFTNQQPVQSMHSSVKIH